MPPEFSGGICFWSFAILVLNVSFEPDVTDAACCKYVRYHESGQRLSGLATV